MSFQPSPEAIDAAAQAYVDAVARRDAKPARQAAQDAHTPGGPDVDELEARIRQMRGLPLRDTA